MVPQGKTKAVITYLLFVGMFIAISMNKDETHEFASWHIKNSFGLALMFFVSVVMSYQEYLIWIGAIFFYGSMFAWLYSFIMALLNRKSGIPWLSDRFAAWFKFLD